MMNPSEKEAAALALAAKTAQLKAANKESANALLLRMLSSPPQVSSVETIRRIAG